jgi:hypothetical protein
MKKRDIPPSLYLNGLFNLIIGIGVLGISLTQLPMSILIAMIWAIWIIINYLFLIRLKLCRFCCYYGERCPLGWGILIPLFFSKGDTSKFSRQGWSIIYLISYAMVPPLLMIISLFYQWDLSLLSVLIIFIFLGFLLYWGARSRCCVQCRMRSECLWTRIGVGR